MPITSEQIIFKSIDKSSFIKIWNSIYQDQQRDSFKSCFEDTPEEEWKPIFDRWMKIMYQAFLNDKDIGYIFLSPKQDQTAHLGYGLYKEFRGQGLGLEMCEAFLSLRIPSLPKEISSIIGTALVENKPSIRVLEKLGFEFQSHFEDDIEGVHVEYNRYKLRLK